MNTKKVISAYVPNEVAEAIKREAKRKDVSPTKIATRIIEQAVAAGFPSHHHTATPPQHPSNHLIIKGMNNQPTMNNTLPNLTIDGVQAWKGGAT